MKSPLARLLVRLAKFFTGLLIIVVGTIGLFVNFHDMMFLTMNVIFLIIGVSLFLTPITARK